MGAFLLYNVEIWDIMEVGSYTYGGIVMERNIKYQYFKMDSQIKLNGNWVDEGAFDFIGWIDYINKNALEQETIKLKDTKARIEKIEFFNKANVWIVRFMKLREENLPYLAKEKYDAEDIPLQPDEYIGEDMYMLYDIDNQIAMIQSNRFSLGINRLGEFLIKSQKENDKRVRLWPIRDNIDVTSLKKIEYRTIELGFANIVNVVNTGKSSLTDILNTYRKFSGVSGTIKIGIGRSKDGALDAIEVDKLIADIKRCENITSAKVKIRDDDLARIEVIDLLDENVSDIITYKLEPRESLSFDVATSYMIERYQRRKDKILNLITRSE